MPSHTAVTLSGPQEARNGQPVSAGHSSRRRVVDEAFAEDEFKGQTLVRFTDEVDDISRAADDDRQQSPPPQYPASEASGSTSASLAFRAAPPPFSSLFTSPSSSSQPDPDVVLEPDKLGLSSTATSPVEKPSAPAYAPLAPGPSESSSAYQDTVAETKRALPRDTKAEGSSQSKEDEAEPPPAYSEGPSPLQSFTFLMAAAGGAASIITQVQQGGPPINAIGGKG